MEKSQLDDWQDVPLAQHDSGADDWQDVGGGGPEISGLESFGRGAAQGATLGFADEIAGAAGGAFSRNEGEDFADAYRRHRDESRANFAAAEKANPKLSMAGNLTGGLATAAIPGLGGATLAKAALAGGAAGLGFSNADLTEGEIGGAAKDVATGAALGGAGGIIGEKVVAPALKGLGNLGSRLTSKAENLAETATGATRVQAEKFAPNAGRELLDRRMVRFGDTPGDIAKRAAGEMKTAAGELDNALTTLDTQGVKVSKADVLGKIDARLSSMQADPSKAPQVRQLEKIREDISSAFAQTEGEEVPVSTIEKWKRGYGDVNWQDPEAAIARKGAYRTLRSVVEDKALAADPDLAARFGAEKELYGLLAPVQEAAEKRNLQLQQHPIFGLNDMMAATGGSVAGGPLGGVATTVGRRLVAPRIASSGAVTSDVAGRILQRTTDPAFKAAAGFAPRLGAAAARTATKSVVSPMDSENMMKRVEGTPYARVLADADSRGEQGLAATHYILQQTDPEYARLFSEGNE